MAWALPARAAAGALVVAWLLADPRTADLAAQVFRADLWAREGPTLWNDAWFAGHHVPGYSLLFPPLGAALGVRAVGAAATLVGVELFARLVRPTFGPGGAGAATLAFAVTAGANLWVGRVTFALGLAVGLGAALLHARGRQGPALVAAAATRAASPIAGLFLALAGLARAATDRRTDGLTLAAAALAPVGLLAVLAPEGGRQPFVASSFWPVALFAGVALIAVGRSWPALRVGTVLYAGATALAYVLDTPMGGNAVRLGSLLGGPVLLGVLWPRHRAAVAALALPLAWWAWGPAVRDVRAAQGDRSARAAYHEPLLEFLASRPGLGRGGARVEIPLTRNHWETVFVARRVALARGWERQLDVGRNGLFYDGRLTPTRYAAWLRELRVAYVAVPDVPLDAAGRAEAALVRRGPPFLAPAWAGGGWQVWAVRRPRTMVGGPARLADLGPDSIALDAVEAGRIEVGVRSSPHWTVRRGPGCVEASGPWLVVRARAAGRLDLGLRLSPGRALGLGARCRAS